MAAHLPGWVAGMGVHVRACLFSRTVVAPAAAPRIALSRRWLPQRVAGTRAQGDTRRRRGASSAYTRAATRAQLVEGNRYVLYSRVLRGAARRRHFNKWQLLLPPPSAPTLRARVRGRRSGPGRIRATHVVAVARKAVRRLVEPRVCVCVRVRVRVRGCVRVAYVVKRA
ncbi:hypothetical protein EON67_07385 [archaeon]|nr:MAG: hypothetical protein EON67_07385 [archaeon]